LTKFETRNGTLYEVKDSQVFRDGNIVKNALFVGTCPLENGKINEPKLSNEGHLCDLIPDVKLGNGAVFMDLAYKGQYWEKIGEQIKLLNREECPRGLLSMGLSLAYKGLTSSITKISC